MDLGLFEVLAELGVIFLLFAVGLETPFSELRKVGGTAMKVAVLGVVLPFLVGFAMFMAIDNNLNEALFIGAAMVATSVGITARVISDMNLTRTLESRIIVGAAVIDDVLGMIVLAIVMGVAMGSEGGILDIILVSAEAVLFVLMVIFLGSILLPKLRRRYAEQRGPSSPLQCGKGSAWRCPLSRSQWSYALAWRSWPPSRARRNHRCLPSRHGVRGVQGQMAMRGRTFTRSTSSWCRFFFLYVGMLVDVSSFGAIIVIAIILTLLAIVTKWFGCGLGS